MGMFDYVNFEFKCPVCGSKVDEFQTKDKDCAMTTVEFYQVDNFYKSCNNCGTWIEFNIKEEARKKLTINDYEITVNTIRTKENYNVYVKILESNGFHKQNKVDVITEESKLVTLKSCKKGQANRIINIECPKNMLWIISPDNLVYLNITDENGTELDENAKLLMCHIRPSEFVNQISRQPYYKFRPFVWKDNLKYFKKIKEGDHFIIALINPLVNVPKENIKFKITFDCWTRK